MDDVLRVRGMSRADAVAQIRRWYQEGVYNGVTGLDVAVLLDALAAAEGERDCCSDAVVCDRCLRHLETNLHRAREAVAAAEAWRDRWHREYRELFDEFQAEREEHGQALAHLGQQVRDAEAARDRERDSAHYWQGEACRLTERATRLAAYRSVLEAIAADDDPRDGCAHADAAKAVLAGDENWREDAKCETYEMPPGKLVGNLRMFTEERYAALLAAEARAARLEVLEPAARALDAVFQECLQHGRVRPTIDLQHRVVADFQAAVRALAAPPGEEA